MFWANGMAVNDFIVFGFFPNVDPEASIAFGISPLASAAPFFQRLRYYGLSICLGWDDFAFECIGPVSIPYISINSSCRSGA